MRAALLPAAAVLGVPMLAGAVTVERDKDVVTGTHAEATAVTGVFHPDAPFYRLLPDDTPVADDSDELVASLRQQAIDHFGQPDQPNLTINTDLYTAPLVVTGTEDPVQDIRPWNCQGKDEGWDEELADALSGRHLPEDLRPDHSSDGNVSIYNQDTGTLVELWQARRAADGQWEACWGGVIEDTSASQGSFPVPYGAAASGLAMWGYTIRHQELLEGEIKHVVGMGIPSVKEGVVSWPAVRSDGRVGGTEIAMGQMLRLPADFDLDSLTLSPAARSVAEAAQDYGLIVTDTSGAVAFAGEHEFGVPDDRYSEIFRGRYSSQEMAGDPARGEDPFPLDELVALPVDYGKDIEPRQRQEQESPTTPDADSGSASAPEEETSPTGSSGGYEAATGPDAVERQRDGRLTWAGWGAAGVLAAAATFLAAGRLRQRG